MMNLEQLIGRHLRLREELARAASSVPWNSGHIDRLGQELLAVERELEVIRTSAELTEATNRFPFLPLTSR